MAGKLKDDTFDQQNEIFCTLSYNDTGLSKDLIQLQRNRGFMLKIFEWCHSQDLLEPHILVTMKD